MFEGEAQTPTEEEELSLAERWATLSEDERRSTFERLPRLDGEELFLELGPLEQAEILSTISAPDRRSWIRLLAPDDAADLLQQCPKEVQHELIELLDRVTKREVTALLAYAEDEAGGLMSPRFARVRPDMHLDEAISYLRRQARRSVETITYAYVLDEEQHLLGVVSLRELFTGESMSTVREVMETDIVCAQDTDNQEEVARLLTKNNLIALPVIDEFHRMRGIVTVDDVVEVLEEETTEDIQKIGGMEALDEPYMHASFGKMLRRRAGWLSALLVGEMFTASAMVAYEKEISQAVVLALFIPLIISSGGNSGSQASTLIVRSLALGEVRTRQWWKILVREIGSGVCLGLILGAMGFLRIVLWPGHESLYGEHYFEVALVVAASLVFVVLWGTVVGSMLPLILQRLKLDPASASAPFVATIVDVTGLIIYFSVAQVFLAGKLL